ncbi:MAG: adenylosuccinate lyase [Clostridia bacterium]|nr:adenylosuccinate lyase [Clostridia bacterium]MBR2054588.1 adenylosuccinate lyase [Clostridia bacterium]MBR6752910.1 adenylosuccinate lyase [Clostridia bacterium]
MNKETYSSPLSTRYASQEMQYLFSEDFKFRTWRRLWVSLARAERMLGLDISKEQIAELEAHVDHVNYEVAEARERVVRHDVMSHVYAYGLQCPKAAPIIHLGASVSYVGDNADVVILREACKVILKKAAEVIKNLASFAYNYRKMPCLGYTHLQPTKLTTVGKRATLWMYELCMDMENLEFQLSKLKLLGSKGDIGTQSSFMRLFDGDEDKVRRLEQEIALDMGFLSCVPVAGQTYSRKTDAYILSALSGFAQSASKFANDLRLLQAFGEMEEPYEEEQIAASSIPYMHTPIRAERICALSRYVMVEALNPAFTASSQWLERTLDDSANRRLTMPEAFLAVDAILNVYINITQGLIVNEDVVNTRVMQKLPLMAAERLTGDANGADVFKQYRHVSQNIKSGEELIDRLAADENIPCDKETLLANMDPDQFIGRCVSQVEDFLQNVSLPMINKYSSNDVKAELNI